MVPNMTSGVDNVSASDETCPMEVPGPDTHVVQDDRRPDTPSQLEPSNNVWDDSEPEVASESDGEDDNVFFKPSPSLPSPNVIKRTLRELNDLMNTPYLDLSSSEHRSRQYEGDDELTAIIDSLFQNYEFPPIFFNQKQVRGPDGSIQYNRVCIDGLKRLSAIKAFMDGEISCHDYRRRKWFYYVDSKDDLEASAVRRRRALPRDDKENFQNKHFVCHEFEDLTGSEEIELRARVHLGSTLTPGEKLRAAMVFAGELKMNFAKTLESDFQQIADLADTCRMKGFQNLMKCSSQISEIQRAGAQNRAPLLRISETALNDFVKNADASALERIKEALGDFRILVTRHPEVFHSISGVPFRPMEMIIIAVLVFKCYQTNVEPSMLIRLIRSLRESTHVFSRHQGVLQTHQTWNHAWDFIKSTEKYVVEGEVTQNKQFVSTMPEEVAALELNQHLRSRASSATFSSTYSFPGMRVGGSPTSLSQQSTAVKRKASPHPLDLAKKRVQLPTPVSPAILQPPRVSLRAGSPDSVLGSGRSEDDRVTETTGGTIQEEPPAQIISPVPAPRQLVRSSFKSRSEFLPRRSESPKGNASTLNELIASVPAPPSPSKAASSSPSALNVLFGASQRAMAKPSLLYSHDTKKTVPYQSSGTLSSAEPSLQSDNPPRIRPSGIRGRGRGRGRKSIPGGFSTRAIPTSQSAVELHTASPMPQQNGTLGANMENSALIHPSVSPALAPLRDSTRLSGRPRKDVIPSSTPSTASPPPDLQVNQHIHQHDVETPPPDLQSNQGINQVEVQLPPRTITSHPVESEVIEIDRAQEPGPADTTTLLSEMDGGTCHDEPLEVQSPAEPPAPPVPRAQSILQSRAVSISSSREPSVSRLSTVGSRSTMSVRTTPVPSLIDAKPFVASFKAGGANAIRERRRQEQAELEERKRRKQEAAKLANSATDSVTPKN
ncbi:hypothetical protein BLS_004225 [Venturia inaequalis]|uniref:DUF262 domain-containing protein n=3 Tax=Venturia inaequalis TaxID=5025 RepID=A0A8H3UKI2_VENIN|nr:hypothetical protein BLS_004225 [Venturia inaequalis]